MGEWESVGDQLGASFSPWDEIPKGPYQIGYREETPRIRGNLNAPAPGSACGNAPTASRRRRTRTRHQVPPADAIPRATGSAEVDLYLCNDTSCRI